MPKLVARISWWEWILGPREGAILGPREGANLGPPRPLLGDRHELFMEISQGPRVAALDHLIAALAARQHEYVAAPRRL